MQQQYLNALSECFKVAKMQRNNLATSCLCKLLELSLQPVAAWDYYRDNEKHIVNGVETIFVQDLEDYLQERVKQ